MHEIQSKLLSLAQLEDITKIRRVDLVKKIGCKYPSQITHHLNQLIKRQDLIRRNGRLIPNLTTDKGLISIPIMGEADCGKPTKYADGRIMDHLKISPSLIKTNDIQQIYALLAKGNSMNNCLINNKSICHNDYVVVCKKSGMNIQNNEIVVSIINGVANIKRFLKDDQNKRIVLLSDSNTPDKFAPIFIDNQDEFFIDGIVIDVIKGYSRDENDNEYS